VSEDRVDAIIMGMNPGEAPERDDGVSPASKGNWSRLCQSAADSVGGKWTISEMFFWSSHDLAALRKRVGDFSPYLEFCATQNLVMIAYHRPKVVFQPGLGWLRDAVRFYNLTKVETIYSSRRRRRLIEHYCMHDGTNWLCTPHWTASFGFSGDDMNDIKAYAAALPSKAGDKPA
jgi:hypothetical protein